MAKALNEGILPCLRETWCENIIYQTIYMLSYCYSDWIKYSVRYPVGNVCLRAAVYTLTTADGIYYE